MEALEGLFFGRFLQLLAVEDGLYLPVQGIIFLCQHQALCFRDVVAVTVVGTYLGKSSLDIRLQLVNGLQSLLMLLSLLLRPEGNHHPEDDGNKKQYEEYIQHLIGPIYKNRLLELTMQIYKKMRSCLMQKKIQIESYLYEYSSFFINKP